MTGQSKLISKSNYQKISFLHICVHVQFSYVEMFFLMHKTDFTCLDNHSVSLHFTYNISHKPLQ